MKLYRKKLNSLEDLKRECIRLSYEKKQTSESDLLPSFNSGKASKKKQRKNDDDDDSSGNALSGIVTAAMGLMGGASPVQTALSLAGPAFKVLGKGKPKRILGSIAKDILVAYATGKAVQLGIKGVKWYLRKRKAKKNEEKAMEIVQKIKATQALR